MTAPVHRCGRVLSRPLGTRDPPVRCGAPAVRFYAFRDGRSGWADWYCVCGPCDRGPTSSPWEEVSRGEYLVLSVMGE